MKARQRGAGLLIAVLIIVTVAAFAVIVAASQSAGDVRGNDLHADSVQALLLAETGVERALKRFATGTGCAALAQAAIVNLSSLQMSGATITILAGLTTDFNGVPLVASQTQCRVRVTATITASNVSRTIHAIVDRNLLPGTNNPTFNNRLLANSPTAWTFSPAGTYSDTGGPDGTSPNCRRSARLWIHTAATSVTASGSTTIPIVPVPVTVAAPSTTTVYFHRRIVNRGAGCPNYAGAALFVCPAAAQAGSICFQMTGTAPGSPWTSGNHNVNPAVTLGAVACPYAPNPCETNYNPPVYPAKSSLTINIAAGAPARRNITAFAFSMRLQDTANPQPVYNAARELFLDNIEAVNTTALDAARVQVWRDCSSAADPVNCV